MRIAPKGLFLVVFLVAAPVAATTVGHVVALEGQAQILPGGAEPAAVAATLNAAVDLEDVLVTGPDSRMQVLFEDDTVLSLGPVTRLQIDESIYDPRHQRRVSRIRLFWGKVRSVVRKGWGRQHRYEVETDTAVVGVKGTEFLVDAGPPPTEVARGGGPASGCTQVWWKDGTGFVFNKKTGETVEGAAGILVVSCLEEIFDKVASQTELEAVFRDTIPGATGETGIPHFSPTPQEVRGFYAEVLSRWRESQQSSVVDERTGTANDPLPDDTGPDDTGPDDTGPDDTGPDDTGPDDTGPDDTGPDDTGPDDTGPDDTGPDDNGPDERPGETGGGGRGGTGATGSGGNSGRGGNQTNPSGPNGPTMPNGPSGPTGEFGPLPSGFPSGMMDLAEVEKKVRKKKKRRQAELGTTPPRRRGRH